MNSALMSRPHPQLNDQQFIEGLRSGNNEVLTALYKKYYHVVLKLVISNSGTSDAAKDIYQETVIVLYENVRKPGFELHCQLQTYIYSVARRLWLKQLKRNGHNFLIRENGDHEVADVSDDVGFHQQKEADFEKIAKSLTALGEPCATLIRDFYLRKLNMEEIAEKFGYTNSDNAKNQKYKCLQRLKKHFFERKTTESETEQ